MTATPCALRLRTNRVMLSGNQALASYPTACFAFRALQGFALPWLMSFNARQQFFFQQASAAAVATARPLPSSSLRDRSTPSWRNLPAVLVCRP